MFIRPIPPRDFVIPNDALAQNLFDGTHTLEPNQSITLKICANSRRKLFDTVTVENTSTKNAATLTEFDRAVYDAVISEHCAGNEYFTLAKLYRDLGGSETHSLPPAMEAQIRACLNKLLNLRLKFDLSGSAKAKFDVSSVPREGWLLDLVRTPEKINFNGTTLRPLHFLGSALFDLAQMRRQILRVKAESFALPVRHTAAVIAALHYVIRRVREVSGSHEYRKIGGKNRRLVPTILFEELFRRCGFQSPSRWFERDIRSLATLILDTLKAEKSILAWEFGYSERKKITSIILQLPETL